MWIYEKGNIMHTQSMHKYLKTEYFKMVMNEVDIYL